jgi:hypothetical protein
MKKLAIVVFFIGLGITAFSGFKYVTREKVAQIGNLEISANKNHSISWSPLIGVAVMITGGIIFILIPKK